MAHEREFEQEAKHIASVRWKRSFGILRA